MVSWEKVEKKNHIVLVSPRKKVFGLKNEKLFNGIIRSNKELIENVSKNSGFLTRGQMINNEFNNGEFAESDENYKQIVPYVVIINKKLNKIYAYQRSSSKKEAHESRLHGNWSIGVGGHIDFQESFFKKSFDEFLKDNLLREIHEEISLVDNEIKSINLVGFLNDESDAVGRVHLGLIYVLETSATSINPNDSESVHGEFLSFNQLEELFNNKEIKCDNWSRIIVKNIKEIL